MNRCTGCRDISEIASKMALNTSQSTHALISLNREGICKNPNTHVYQCPANQVLIETEDRFKPIENMWFIVKFAKKRKPTKLI